MFLAALAMLQASVTLESLNLTNVEQEWGEAQSRKSVEGNSLKIGGVTYPRGVGTHARSEMHVKLNGASLFHAEVGVDQEAGGRGSVEFEVWLDKRKVWASGVMRGNEAAKTVEVRTVGAKQLDLIVNNGGDTIDYDHADWANAYLVPGTARPFTMASAVKAEPSIPIAMGQPRGTMIHGPRVLGCTPGRPFLFRIPATGIRKTIIHSGMDMYDAPRFTIINSQLPPGVRLDGISGIISGSVKRAGTYRFTVMAGYGRASATRQYTMVAGAHKLTLTPPMGWNSWNVWGTSVDAAKVRAAADAFDKSGLANYGYQFINIDDAWEGSRDAQGFIQTNQKFGDMRRLADYVHGKGLKLGIYSSPGPKTCAGYEASYEHEMQDAQQYAKWGIDYLKYDWCSYGNIAKDRSLPELQKPYFTMRRALDSVDRDIVYSLCQYGMGDVFKWGKKVGGNLWRTTGDITDTWRSMSDIGFAHSEKAGGVSSGGWNDPDMLVVGRLGWGDHPRPTRLAPNEQITHISLWAMAAAPLIIGCDLTKLDAFTKALLTNHDVIEIDQDPLAVAATRVLRNGTSEIWTRPLWDGTIAVALFNRGSSKAAIKANWIDVGIHGRQPVRDVWQMRSLGTRDGSLSATVPAHGAMLFRVGRTKT